MAKLTVLEMTQDILNDMDSDPVNSIDDTMESVQVAQIVKTSYFNITVQRDWPFLRTLSALTGLGDLANPTRMQIPVITNKILWIKYNKKDVCYLEPKAFLDKIQERDVNDPNIDANGYRTDSDPVYWTSYDDEFVVFDAYDSAVESTLQTVNSSAYVTLIPGWTHEDGFVPLLPEKMFPTLLALAKSRAFNVLKQIGSPQDDAIASRGIVRAQNEAYKTKQAEQGSNKIDYGRKGCGSSGRRGRGW
jgi:hypothetical protein